MSLTAGPACGLLFSRHDTPKVAPETTETVVEVESHHWNDVIVYLMNGNQSERLGTATGVSTTRFSVPYRRIASGGRLRLRALPVAGRPFTSETILVLPGQAIFWTLENNLETSNFTVY